MAALLVVMLVIQLFLPICTCLLHCPSSCSFLSPVPYPFGAAQGCGLPSFQIFNCTIASPQWNLQLGDTLHTYYINSIFATPNSSNHSSSVLSYGYGGAVLLSLPTPNTPFCHETDPLAPLISPFSSSNMYAFKGASLSFYQQRYLLFNCSPELALQAPPSSGTFSRSSQHCENYLNHCNLSGTDRCSEYTPDKELSVPLLMSTYGCSSFRRFVIADDDDPVEKWIIGTQFAWGPVDDAESCSSCQNTGGTCGYNTLDNSFLCYCEDDAYKTNCDGWKRSDDKTSVIVGTSVAITVVLALASIGYYYLRQSSYWWRIGKHKQLRLEKINQTPIEFPYGALVAATNTFKIEVGRGAFGKVYRGILPDGNEVAVKVLNASMLHGDVQFTNEVATIGNIHHVNVARLFGFCFSKSKRILVYEYVANGSLDKYLFADKVSSTHSALLSWKQRFDIALDIARGLSYMHEECRKFIIHCDIKPQNILLDASYCAKISDFGLAKLLSREESRVLTQARGTPGYVAPEFWSLGSGPLTTKFDVYSFGMVLLEIVRGERIAHMLGPFSLQMDLEEQVGEWPAVFVDKRIVGNADIEQVRVCTLVALWCIQEDPSQRPTMGRVVQFLQGTTPVPSNPPSPFKTWKMHFKGLSHMQDHSTS